MKARLLVVEGAGVGNSCIIESGGEASIGRNPDCDIPVLDPKLSRIHSIIRSIPGGFELLDSNSTNGTYLNGDKIDTVVELKNHDLIRVGDTKIRFAIIDDFDDKLFIDSPMEVEFDSDIEIEVDPNFVIDIDDGKTEDISKKEKDNDKEKEG